MDLMSKLMSEMNDQDQILKLPPPSMLELKAKIIDYKKGHFLIAEFPFQERFTNPIGLYQGGFLAAAFDEVFGPLAYISANAPCATTNFSLNYVRPFQAEDEKITIKAEVVNQSKSSLVMRAEAKNQSGKLLAIATMQSVLWPKKN